MSSASHGTECARPPSGADRVHGRGEDDTRAGGGQRLDRKVVELDAEIGGLDRRGAGRVRRQGRGVLPRSGGEHALAALGGREPRVVSFGGGAVTSPSVREALHKTAFTVLLDVEPGEAWRRVRRHAPARAGRAAVSQPLRRAGSALPGDRRRGRLERRLGRAHARRGGCPSRARRARAAGRAAAGGRPGRARRRCDRDGDPRRCGADGARRPAGLETRAAVGRAGQAARCASRGSGRSSASTGGAPSSRSGAAR